MQQQILDVSLSGYEFDENSGFVTIVATFNGDEYVAVVLNAGVHVMTVVESSSLEDYPKPDEAFTPDGSGYRLVRYPKGSDEFRFVFVSLEDIGAVTGAVDFIDSDQPSNYELVMAECGTVFNDRLQRLADEIRLALDRVAHE